MPRFWVSWYSPVAKVIEHADEKGDLVERDNPIFAEPIMVRGEWISGYRMSDDAATVVALIDAPAIEAINASLSGWEVRFVEPREDDYVPGDRFPMPPSQT